MKKAGIDDWVTGQRLKKWQLAGHTSKRTDGSWSTYLLEWTPPYGKRKRGHPELRLLDDINSFVKLLGEDWFWRDLAGDRQGWSHLACDYAMMSTKGQ